MSDIIDEHRLYLSDVPRLEAYQAALAEVVNPGDVVVDLGAGSGILGMLACRAGAGRVYALEQTSLIDLTRRIARDNDLGDRIVHVREASTHTSLPEKADVVVCDQIGRFGFEAGVFGFFADAARRFTNPDARFVPSHMEFLVAPVSVPERAGDVSFWNTPVLDFDVSAAAPIARNSGYPMRLEASHLLGPLETAARRVTTDEDAFFATTTLRIERPGQLHGLGCAFRAELAPGVFVTNAPAAAARIERRNVFLPLESFTAVSAGDTVQVRLHFIPRETVLSWTVRVVASDGTCRAESRHSTFKGMFLCKEDMQVTSPAHAPTLSPWGHARRSVLELCDGNTPLRDIERAVAERHPDLFPSLRDASCFVAEVVTRYAT